MRRDASVLDESVVVSYVNMAVSAPLETAAASRWSTLSGEGMPPWGWCSDLLGWGFGDGVAPALLGTGYGPTPVGGGGVLTGAGFAASSLVPLLHPVSSAAVATMASGRIRVLIRTS
jgi:hypothetical protein